MHSYTSFQEKPKEKTIFSVKLESFEGTAKPKIIREVKAMNPTLTLVAVSTSTVNGVRCNIYVCLTGQKFRRIITEDFEGEFTKGRGRKNETDLRGDWWRCNARIESINLTLNFPAQSWCGEVTDYLEHANK